MKEEPKPAESLGGVEFAVLLGSGLGILGDGYQLQAAVRFENIPGLTHPDIRGHAGEIQRRLVGSRPCLFVSGRKHYYEGKTGEIECMIRFLHSVGVRKLLVTSAASMYVLVCVCTCLCVCLLAVTMVGYLKWHPLLACLCTTLYMIPYLMVPAILVPQV